VPKKITQITGITQAMVDSDGLPLSDVLVQFKEFIGDLPIVTFNAAFDMGFIWRAAKKHGVPIENRYACALKMARRAYPDLPSHRLADLAKMGNLSDDNTHRALGDCKRTVPVFMSSVMKIGERIMWEVPPVDWRTSAQYNAERDANRAFVAETRALEATEPELTITRYRQAMARMYEYEKLIYSWHGDERILDRITLVLGKLGRYEELIKCVDEFVARFPEEQSSMMTGILNRKRKAESKLESTSGLVVQ
jgi:DNA polymerase III epsilon subunit-like protein